MEKEGGISFNINNFLFYFSLVFLIILFSFNVISIEEETKTPNMVCLSTINYPPYYGPELENYGFITEIIETAFDRKDYSVEIEFMSWPDALEKTKVGECDGIYTLWYREDREQWYAYSNALPANEVVFCKTFT